MIQSATAGKAPKVSLETMLAISTNRTDPLLEYLGTLLVLYYLYIQGYKGRTPVDLIDMVDGVLVLDVQNKRERDELRRLKAQQQAQVSGIRR